MNAHSTAQNGSIMARFKWILMLLPLFLIFPAGSLFAITDEEIFRNFQFSFLNPGARSTGMGNAFVALADDATAAEANPAGLTILNRPEVSLEYRNSSYDPDKLNSLNDFRSNLQTLQVLSQNNLDTINTVSFFSMVVPTKGFTLAFSYQEPVRLQGKINEIINVQTQVGNQATLIFLSEGDEKQKVTNWNFSLAKKFHRFSFGATLRYSHLSWETSTKNSAEFVIESETETFPTFDTSMNQNDNALGFNAGFLYRPVAKVTVGAVYKHYSKFEGIETETGEVAKKPGSFRNVLNLPDSVGVGVAFKPNDIITVSSDLVWIKYSDLLDGFQTQYNQLTDPSNYKGIRYHVDNALEFHAGAEYYVLLKDTPIALRAGYYRKPSNSIVADSTDIDGDFEQSLAKAFFAKGQAENHITIGSGVVFSHFQVDVAFDAGKRASHFVLSTVARF